MCCLLDWHISQPTETRSVWYARWGLLSALLHRCICSSGAFTTKHSSDSWVLVLPVWSFSHSQNKRFHSAAWIEKNQTAFVFHIGNRERSSFCFTQCTAELSNTELPGGSAVLLTPGKPHSSPGLLQPVTTRPCLSYKLEIKIQFNVWHLLSSQYIFSNWALIAAGIRDMKIDDMYRTHTMEPPDF